MASATYNMQRSGSVSQRRGQQACCSIIAHIVPTLGRQVILCVVARLFPHGWVMTTAAFSANPVFSEVTCIAFKEVIWSSNTCTRELCRSPMEACRGMLHECDAHRMMPVARVYVATCVQSSGML